MKSLIDHKRAVIHRHALFRAFRDFGISHDEAPELIRGLIIDQTASNKLKLALGLLGLATEVFEDCGCCSTLEYDESLITFLIGMEVFNPDRADEN